ncbi:hypothetical protein [uncultured Chitinophaga sp.]|jgi:hypothetical protein|uniref:hypothetical protein n=1 Tax=uncultured Chitinophaga sp. TaxID=339340 RepID=UPI002613CDEB|nr:hypothetical protein [uncultured Chitinophaga sp.]
MSISKHIHSLQQHLAKLGLQRVPAEGPGENDQPGVFRICFLNKYEMQQWKKLQERSSANAEAPINALPAGR